ncbi:MAG: DUF3035 domain-containing protein [Alphaproteobacteria bacterium]
MNASLRTGTARVTGLRLAAAAAVCLVLPGCSGLAKALGLTKSSPDEFAIVTKAPLVIPPDFSLRPPRPGAKRPQDVATSQTAAALLFTDYSDSGEQAERQSRGEQALLSKAGALQADASIRRVLEAETTMLARKDRSFADQILFWRGEDSLTEQVVDAASEPDRVSESLDSGRRTEASLAPSQRRQGWF